MKPPRGGLTPAGLGFSIAVLLMVVGGAVAGSYYMGASEVAPTDAPAPVEPSGEQEDANDAALPVEVPPEVVPDDAALPPAAPTHRARDAASTLLDDVGDGVDDAAGADGDADAGDDGSATQDPDDAGGEEEAPPDEPGPELPGAPPTPLPGDDPEEDDTEEDDTYYTEPVEDLVGTVEGMVEDVETALSHKIQPSVPPAGTSILGLR